MRIKFCQDPEIILDAVRDELEIEGMRFNVGGLKTLRRVAEKTGLIRVSLQGNGTVVCETIDDEAH